MVTYQRGLQLRDYFLALQQQDRQLDSLLIVDNDPLESARWVLESHGLNETRVDYIATGENIGPAGGIALGMRRLLTIANDDDWILTLDDDDPPRTSEMLGELERFGNDLLSANLPVGGVGLCGGRFDVSKGRLVTVADAELVGAVPSSWIGGNQLPCYAAAAVRDVGVFDERFFINFEELDFGLRMEDHGLTLYAHGDLWRREREFLGRTTTELSPQKGLGEPHWRRYYSLRNLVFLLRSRGHQVSAFRVAATAIAKPIYNSPRSPALAWRHLRQNTRAIVDAYRSRMGRTVSPAPKPYAPRA
jgi:hypothetical protein